MVGAACGTDVFLTRSLLNLQGLLKCTPSTTLVIFGETITTGQSVALGACATRQACVATSQVVLGIIANVTIACTVLTNFLLASATSKGNVSLFTAGAFAATRQAVVASDATTCIAEFVGFIVARGTTREALHCPNTRRLSGVCLDN
jgi:hypothetical protein